MFILSSAHAFKLGKSKFSKDAFSVNLQSIYAKAWFNPFPYNNTFWHPWEWSLLKTLGKGEIACNELFLFFPQCFLSVWITFCHLENMHHFYYTHNLKFFSFSNRRTIPIFQHQVFMRMKISRRESYYSCLEALEKISQTLVVANFGTNFFVLHFFLSDLPKIKSNNFLQHNKFCKDASSLVIFSHNEAEQVID